MVLAITGAQSSLLGVDLIFDTNTQQWRVLEVNSRVGGFALFDHLARRATHGVFEPHACDRVASLLASRSRGGRVGYVLPRSVHDLSMLECPSAADAAAARHDDFMIPVTAMDYRALRGSLGPRLKPLLADDFHRSGMAAIGNDAGVIYSLCSEWPAAVPESLALNSLTLASVCSDKLKTAALLSDALGESCVVPTTTGREEAASRHGGSYVVRKPRFGGGGRDVLRCRRGDLGVDTDDGKNEPTVWQPWIEPPTARRHGHAYYFDVRVLIACGLPIGGVVRQAAAPHQGVAAESPLAWLTTTGPVHPCEVGMAGHADPYTGLGTEQWGQAQALATAAVDVLCQVAER